MLSGKGQLTIDGSDPVPVDYDLGDDGRGYLTAARPLVVRAHLGHRVELQRDNRTTLRLVIDDIGSTGGGDFRVQEGGAR